jgi:hypothetical protein
MNRNDPKFKEAVEHAHCAMKRIIQDNIYSDPGFDRSSRFRLAVTAVSGESISLFRWKDLVVEFHSDAFQLIMADLKAGYEISDIESMEEFDHQARDWVAQKADQLFNENHSWCAKLKENPGYTALLFFGFGSILGTRPDGGVCTTLLPTAYCQLIDYTGGDDIEGKIIDMESWQLKRDGIFINSDMLKQFGRNNPEKNN